MPGKSRSSNKEGKAEAEEPGGMGNEASSRNPQPDKSNKDPPDKPSRVNSKQSNVDQKHDPRNSNIPSRAGSKKSADDAKRPSNPSRTTRVVSKEPGSRQDSKNGRSTTAASGADGGRDGVVDDTSVYNYSDYYRPPGYGEPVLAARVELNTAPGSCSCYPKRSSHGIPSMMYDRVTCEHCGITGSAHDGVYAFDDGWSVSFETSSRPRTRKPADITHVRGYPRPELEQIPESPAVSEASAELRDLFDEMSVSSGSRGEASVRSKRNASQNSQRKSIAQSIAGSEHPPQIASPAPASRRSVSVASNQHVQQGTQTDDVKDVPSRIMTFHRLRNQEEKPTTSDIENMHVPQIGYDPTLRVQTRGSHHSISPPSSRDGRPVVVVDTDRKNTPVRYRRPRRFGVNYMVRVFTPVQEEYLVTHAEDNSGARQTHRRNGPLVGAYHDPVTHETLRYEVAHDTQQYLFH